MGRKTTKRRGESSDSEFEEADQPTNFGQQQVDHYGRRIAPQNQNRGVTSRAKAQEYGYTTTNNKQVNYDEAEGDAQMDKMLQEETDKESSSIDITEDKDKEKKTEEVPKNVSKTIKEQISQAQYDPLDHVIECIIKAKYGKCPAIKAKERPADMKAVMEIKGAGYDEEDEKKEENKEEEEDEEDDDPQGLMITSQNSYDESKITPAKQQGPEQFLVKYKDQAYLNCKWITERDFAKMGFQCQQKLHRFKIKREKLAKGILIDTFQPQNLGPGEFFDQHFMVPDKIVSGTNLFPVIHPRQAKNVIDTWRERCILILQLICAYQHRGHSYATPFLYLRSDEKTVMDLTTINNRLYTIPSSAMLQQQQAAAAQNPGKSSSCYSNPYDFWQDLGTVFTEAMVVHSPESKEFMFAQTLRELAYYLYMAWYEQIKEINAAAERAEALRIIEPIEELSNLLAKRTETELAIKRWQQQKLQTPAAANPQAMQSLARQQQVSLLALQKLGQTMGSSNFKPEMHYVNTPEKMKALQQVQVTMQKFIAILTNEQNLGTPGFTGGMMSTVNGQHVSGDSASYKFMLQQQLKIVMPAGFVPNQNTSANPIVIGEEKKQDTPAAPLVPPPPAGNLVLGQNLIKKIAPGEERVAEQSFNLRWLLRPEETLASILGERFLNKEMATEMLAAGPAGVDPIYYVKWKNLSYQETTWEKASLIRSLDFSDTKLKDFDRFNRSLDHNSRQKMTGFIYAHKQIIKIYQKKASSGKKIDAKSAEEIQTREMLSKLLKFEAKSMPNGYFQYDYAKKLVPQFRGGQQCKDYQISGLNWMLRAFQDNRNIVLADEMGLGKTIQTIALLDHLIKICKIRGPFLVIAPLSTLDHWKKVAEEWTYMNVVIYHDRNGQDGRGEIRNQDWYYTDVTNKGTITQKSKLTKFNLMITSYEVFNGDLLDVLIDIPFQYIIVDEAHRLKNKQAKTLVLLKEHPCRRILLLTGTPIQNNTKELFTLLQYLEPDTFCDFNRFMEQFGTLASSNQVEKLIKMLEPHFLRRMKDEVEDSIPPLNETVIDVDLTQLQQAYYKGIYGENLSMLASLGSASAKTCQFNNIDIQLRKCCNHLFLLKGVEEELNVGLKTDEEFYKKILEGSGKLVLLDKFIEKYKEENHKVLVFSQFKGMIDIIAQYLVYKGIRHEILTGSVKSQDRVTAIQRFNEDNEFGVFLLTTRAGGLGINLTKARVVVIFDSDWNPQNDLQAIARAHRIGQQFEVSVYRLITARTYEQQMFDRASKKLGMEQALFQKGAFANSENTAAAELNKISPQEVENLLKFGAYAFLGDEMEDEEEGNDKKRAVQIEDILKNKKEKKEKPKNKKSGDHTIQRTAFKIEKEGASKEGSGKNTNKKGEKLKSSDPNFWEKIMPFDGYNPKQLNRKFRAQKKDIVETKETQSKFLKDVSKCVKDLLEKKAVGMSCMLADEETYDLLKRITKEKAFQDKYRDKATVLLDKMLHFTDYQIIQDAAAGKDLGSQEITGDGRRKRKAKGKVDYTDTGNNFKNNKRDQKAFGKKKNKYAESGDELESGQDDLGNDSGDIQSLEDKQGDNENQDTELNHTKRKRNGNNKRKKGQSSLDDDEINNKDIDAVVEARRKNKKLRKQEGTQDSSKKSSQSNALHC